MDYIPHDEAGFNSFESTFMDKMVPNAPAWNIPASAVTALESYQTVWHNAWEEGGYIVKKSRTSTQVMAKDNARKAYEYSKLPQPLGLRAFISAYITNNPLVSNNQRLEMGLPVHKKKRTTHRVATKNIVVFDSQNIGSGVVITKCYNYGLNSLNPYGKGEKRTARPCKEKGYNIRISYVIIDKGDTLPKGPNDKMMRKEIFTKARIVRHFGTDNQGRILCEYAQWYNITHPELAGPWSALKKIFIS